MDSIPSSYSSSDGQDLQDNTPDEQEEKARLITQVLELQNTLDGKFSADPDPGPTQNNFLQISRNGSTVSKRRTLN